MGFILLSISAANFHDLKPVALEFAPILKAIPSSVYAYSGPLMIAGFVFPYLNQPQKAAVWTSVAILIVALVYTFVTLLSIAVFSAEELHYILYPPAALLRAVELPGGFLERLDAFFIILYIPINFTTLIALHYFAAHCIARQMKLEEQRPVALLTIPVIYFVAILLSDTPSSNKFAEMMGKSVFFYAAIGVPLIWIIAHVRHYLRH